MDLYTTSIEKSLKDWQKKLNVSADTLYIGGGTPSIIGAKRLNRIISAAKNQFKIEGEITIECNPSSVEMGFFKAIANVGANRISLGLQSAVESERSSLGRLAGRQNVLECIKSAKSAGIKNISLDVMLGIPNQSAKSLDETLNFCINSGVEHISAYMLKIEEGTPFFNQKNSLNLPDDDFTADLYLQMVSTLQAAGFSQYEISNFSIKGFESKHNLKYWNCDEYLGLGPSAHSFINKKRFFYPRDIEKFISNPKIIDDGAGGDVQEYIMLRLRLCKGIAFDDVKGRFPLVDLKKLKSKAQRFEKEGFVVIDDKGFHFTPKGFLISNFLIKEIIC